MKKFLWLLLIVGCSNVERPRENPSTLSQSLDAFCFSDVFLDAPEVDIEQQIKKLRSEYTWKSETDVFRNSFTCSYQHKEGGETNGGKVGCEYLGNYRGQDIVARWYWPGGSGVFTDIVFYSVRNGKLRVKITLVGDRAMDGRLSHPIFDGQGKIYFYMNLSNATLLSEAGLDEKIVQSDEGFTCAACYGIVGKCVYDIKEEKMKVLSITAFSNENRNSKIRSLIQPKMNNGIAIFNEEETLEFLQKLRKMYMKK
ncbi:MAG: hypothetical protein LBS14_03950 [Holosporaceae bacterium]|jgi:hypothetical protein|nr:hypothetical protein [Holosporaceae bacterium]